MSQIYAISLTSASNYVKLAFFLNWKAINDAVFRVKRKRGCACFWAHPHLC
jgi:hypothetical protein